MMHYKNNHGLTLLELTVGMTLFLIIIAAVVPLFTTSLSITSTGMIKNNLLQEGRWAVDTIAKELSTIDIAKITVPVAPTATKESQAYTLSFSPFRSNQVITYEVRRGTGEIYRLTHPLTDGDRVIVNDGDLVFTRNKDNESIDISLTVRQQDNKNKEYTETITTTVKPLNNKNDN